VYVVVDNPGAGIYSSIIPVLNLVCYVSLCEGLHTGAGSLSSIVHVDLLQ